MGRKRLASCAAAGTLLAVLATSNGWAWSRALWADNSKTVIVGGGLWIASATAQEGVPPEIIAVQIRKQGFACQEAQSAVRDRKASAPNAAVWVLRCGNATYRVRLTPDMAAQVERIE
jgi:hypothetical protein